MDEKVVTAIHELANALAGLGSWQQQLVSMAILLVVAAGGSFFGAYLKTRATNAAISADLEKIKGQLTTTTNTTETIKSQIGKRGELHTLRIKKLEELMESFLKTQDVYRHSFETLITGKPVVHPTDSGQHLIMLTKFYFPDLEDAIGAFNSDWWFCLIDTNLARQERVKHEDKDIVEIMLELWRQNGFPLRDEAENEGAAVEKRLVQTMHVLLGEEGPKDAGPAPA